VVLRRAATFVAIVWAIAGSLILMELLTLRGMELLLAYPAFDRVTLSSATRGSTSCAAPPVEDAPAPPSLSPAEARFAVWLLGLNTGRDAITRNQDDPNAVMLAEFEAGAREIAGFLDVPAPDPFVAQRLAAALSEFVTYIESSDRVTAVELARRHGGNACELYKLGALWGYATVMRTVTQGERGVFAVEIRHHARTLGLPEPLWSPLTRRTPADQTSEALAAEGQALTDAMLEYLQRPDPAP
jgi:hypothetical protein